MEIRSKAAMFSLLGHESEAIAARFGPGGFHRHYHDTFSFGLVADGVNAFGYRRRSYEAEAGSIGIADPGETHDGGQAGRPWAYRSAFPSAEAMTAVAAELGMDGLPAFPGGTISDPLSVRRLHVFLSRLFAPDEEPAAVEEAGLDAFATIIRRNAAGVRPRHAPVTSAHAAAKALELIHDRWDEPVGLDEMAAAAGVSRSSVIRAVERATGLPPHAYLMQLRIHRAKQLIRAGTPIAIAAVEAGFVDQAHFTRATTRRWGVTPGAFKLAYARARELKALRRG